MTDVYKGQDLAGLLASCGFYDYNLSEALVIATFESGDPRALREHLNPDPKGLLNIDLDEWMDRVHLGLDQKPEMFNARRRAFNENDPHGGSFGIFQINGYWLKHGHEDPQVGPFQWGYRFDARYNARFANKLYRRSGWRPWSTAKHLSQAQCDGRACTERSTDGYVVTKTHPQSDLIKLPKPYERLLCLDCYEEFRTGRS